MSSYRYIGVDLETSGTTHERHVPIQIGVALRTGEIFNQLIGGWDWDEYDWDMEAQGIHNITQGQLVNQGYPVGWVDVILTDWLHHYVPTGTKVMVGWNVGTFDRPFIQRWLPKTHATFIRRTLDLNAACYLLEEHGVRSSDTVKKQAKAYADGKLAGGSTNRHDAAYDAMCAIYELEYLRSLVRGRTDG